MLRARPLAPLAAGFVAGITLALIQGTWVPQAALGALYAIVSIRRRHPLLLTVLGLGLIALRLTAPRDGPAKRPRLRSK